MVFKRPSKTRYYLDIAAVVSTRSTCLRRQYGAVIVKNDRIIATGYNGAARGRDNCSDVGECWRLTHGIPHGEQYEKCQAVHAEANAIASADGEKMYGATLYLAGFEVDEDGNRIQIADPKPCEMCDRLIINAGIKNVITKESDLL